MTPIIGVMWVVVILSIFGTSAALVPHPGCPMHSTCGKHIEECPHGWHDSAEGIDGVLTHVCVGSYADEKSCVDSIKNELATLDN